MRPMRLPSAPTLLLRTGSPNNSRRTVSTAITGRSRLRIEALKECIGAIIAAIPTTMSVLNRFDPIMLPMARSFSPLRAAAMELASSGSEVPTATMVRPISKSLTPRARAISTAPHTSARELATNRASPSTSHRIDFPRERFSPSPDSDATVSSAATPFFWRSSLTTLKVITPAKTSSTTIPSSLLMEPSIAWNMATAVTAINTGRSRTRAFRTTMTGEIIAVTPRMRAMFAMLLP